MLRAGRAVETDHVDRESFEDGERGGDVGAEQHPARGVERDRGLDRDALAGLRENLLGSMNRGFELEDVLHRLDDQDVGAAVDQPADLVEEELLHLLECVLAEHRIFRGGQQSGRTDRAGDEARARRRAVVVGHLARQLGGEAVLLVGALAETVFLELDLAAAEGVGFEHVATDFHVAGVDAFDDAWVDEHEILVAPLETTVVLGGELHVEYRGAHRAVVDDDALAREVEELAHQSFLDVLRRSSARCSGADDSIVPIASNRP